MVEKKPFEGVKVLDFTWVGVGPLTMNNLAYYGATVVKIENPATPDITRTNPPFKDNKPGLERSAYFAWSNPAKKYDITLNLSHPEGVALVKRLVAWADVVADSFRGGIMEDRWGLSYEELKKIKHDIIVFHTCTYGQTGPFAKSPGTGNTLTSLAGFNNVASWPDRPPSPLNGPYTDFIAPLFGSLALIAALDYRDRTGKGQELDQSQLEAGINFLAPLILDYTVNQRELTPNGNHLPYAAPHGAYRCRGDDRWCAIGVFSDEEWKGFCRVMGDPEWTKNPKFSTVVGRVENADELDRRVEAWTINFTAEQVMAMMQAAGVAAGVVSNAQDQAEDPQIKHYRFFRDVDHPEMGKISFCHGPGLKLSEIDWEVGTPPLLGQDNEYVYTQILGLSDEEFSQFIEKGVI